MYRTCCWMVGKKGGCSGLCVLSGHLDHVEDFVGTGDGRAAEWALLLVGLALLRGRIVARSWGRVVGRSWKTRTAGGLGDCASGLVASADS